MQKIRLGIVGYGNLGRGVQYAAKQNPDTETADYRPAKSRRPAVPLNRFGPAGSYTSASRSGILPSRPASIAFEAEPCSNNSPRARS